MKDRRVSVRRQTEREGCHHPCMVRVEGERLLRAVVLDQGGAGVRVRLVEPHDLPDRMEVFCVDLALNGEGRLMWQGGREAGLLLT